MIKSKIDPKVVGSLTWKDYAKLFDKDVKQAQDKGFAKVPLVMVSDYEFACGEVHALMLLGKQSVMSRAFKTFKAERNKEKDFSIGFCHLDKDENGAFSMRISIEGFGKPNAMKKNSKKLLKRLGVDLKEIIKGSYTDEVVESIEKENETADEATLKEGEQLQEAAEAMKASDDESNDDKKLGAVAKEFLKANKGMTTKVITLLKLASSETVTYTQMHVDTAKDAFRAAASLLDKYKEVEATEKDLAKKAKKIAALKDNIVQNNLVKKYETIWKKVQQEYSKQIDGLSEPFKAKLQEYHKLMAEILKEEASSNN